MTGVRRFDADPDALAARLGDEIVLVQAATDQIYLLNRTGARVWELLCEGLDRAEVERRLMDEFDVAPAVLAADVDALIGALQAERLVAAAPAEPAA